MDRNSQILTAFKSGDHKKILKDLYKTLLPKVQRYVRANSGNEDDGNDIFQDAVMIVYKQIMSNQFDTNIHLEAYLFTVAKNRWINKAKRDAKIKAVDELPEPEQLNDSIFDLLVTKEREHIIQSVLGNIGEQCKKLLHLIFYQGYSLAEVTEIMKFTSAEVAHTTHYRCKKKLKTLVGENVEFKKMLMNHG